jgi:hypothetical protein
MSFTRDFNAEVERLAPLFAAAENADQEFHRAWKEGCNEFGYVRYKQTERYSETLDRFREATRSVDEVISTAYAQARLGDATQLPTLFAYIALPGRYFRSGYQRAGIWRLLKRLSLDEKQSGILHEIMLRQIQTAGPEFVEIARMAVKVNSPYLREHLKLIALQSGKGYVLRRVNRLLARLEPRST